MAKANSVVQVTRVPNEGEGGGFTIDVSVMGAGSVSFDPRQVHEGNRDYAEFHGWKQRFVDAAAISRDPKTGESASPSDKLEAIMALVEHYESGTEKWSRVSEAGPKGGLLFDALCVMYGHMKAPSEIRAWLDGLTDKEQAALREDDEVTAQISAIKRERAEKSGDPKVDTKGLLAGLKA